MSEDTPNAFDFIVLAVLVSVIGLSIGAVLLDVVSISLSQAGSIASILSLSIVGYKYLESRGIDLFSTTAGSSDDEDFGIFPSSPLPGLERDDERAQQIIQDDEYRRDGSGNHPELLREVLAPIFKSDRLSNTRFEAFIFAISVLSLALFIVAVAELWVSSSGAGGITRQIAGLYPEFLTASWLNLPFTLSIFGMLVGFLYLESKGVTTCPEGTPFALKSEGRYFRLDDLRTEKRTNNGETRDATIAYGVHVYRCLDHGAYFVREEEWERG